MDAQPSADPRRYDDMLDLPRPEPRTHPRMAQGDRAAQFAPFAALTGFDGEIAEAGRLTERERALGEAQQEEIEAALQALAAELRARPPRSGAPLPRVEAVYFLPDGRKAGGRYVQASGRLRRIDLDRRQLLLEGGECIPFAGLLCLSQGAEA